MKNTTPSSDVMHVMTHRPQSVTSTPVTGKPQPADRTAPCVADCVYRVLISTQVRAKRKQPKESEWKSCSCFITQQQVPWTAINNLQPDGQVLCFPPGPDNLPLYHLTQLSASGQSIHVYLCVAVCLKIVFPSLLAIKWSTWLKSQKHLNTCFQNGFCD